MAASFSVSNISQTHMMIGLFSLLAIIAYVNPTIVRHLNSTILGRLVIVIIIIYFSSKNMVAGLLATLVVIAIMQTTIYQEGLEGATKQPTSSLTCKKGKVLLTNKCGKGAVTSDLKNYCASGTITRCVDKPLNVGASGCNNACAEYKIQFKNMETESKKLQALENLPDLDCGDKKTKFTNKCGPPGVTNFLKDSCASGIITHCTKTQTNPGDNSDFTLMKRESDNIQAANAQTFASNTATPVGQSVNTTQVAPAVTQPPTPPPVKAQAVEDAPNKELESFETLSFSYYNTGDRLSNDLSRKAKSSNDLVNISTKSGSDDSVQPSEDVKEPFRLGYSYFN